MESNINSIENNDYYKKLLTIFIRLKPKYKKDLNKIIITSFQDVISESDEKRIYTVYKININSENFVLKKSEESEIFIYKTFLESKNLPTPKMFGYTFEYDEYWILIEYIEGTDLKKFNEQIALNSSISLSKIFNKYWVENDFDKHKLDNRFEKYYARIIKRSKCLTHHANLSKAYKCFLERQLTCPRTLCNGDLMQINAINSSNDVLIIDWGFGGIMPYSLDIARLISHGAERDDPFYMTNDLRNLFAKKLYKLLNTETLTYSQYIFDIKLSMLNEFIEFLEYNFNNPNEEKDHYYNYYLKRANKLADELLDYVNQKDNCVISDIII
ncbi:phosphotransferase [Clostridium sp. ATCC 25772]|uniref:phosphotransferase n=1 Tax=Clostridium sp. ATCC 25772 TaxID=1676991 RepID=UPI0007829490|nr:phosphotransferase [Clostridium sp. ATCC 25772]